MKQLVSAQSVTLAQEFLEDKQFFCRQLAKQGNDATWYTQAFNPYPLVIAESELSLQKRLQMILHAAICQLVANYFSDKRIEQILRLPDHVAALLKTMDGRQYRVGSWRPDFVHDQSGSMKICEINARFPTNAFFISHYINNIVPDLQYLSGASNTDSVDPQPICVLPIPGLDHLPSTFVARLKCSKRGSKIGLIKGREHGWDITFLRYELDKDGIPYSLVEPEALTIVNGGYFDGGDSRDNGDGGADHQELSCLYLELHQDEFRQRLRPDVLAKLATDGAHFNDLRTIYLVHDKRFLALLYDSEILEAYISAADASLLRSYLVPTFVVLTSPESVDAALQDRQDWVLKPNLFGKGQGIIFGKNVSADAWHAALRDPANGDYVLQRYVAQKQFPIVNSGGADEQARIMDVNVVGTMLCFDDIFFGPGIYRASPGDIVNVAGGGTVLFPVLSHSSGVADA